MRPPDLVYSLCIIQLDVQVLIDAFQCPADLDLVLELYGDLVFDERLEETAVSLAHCSYGKLQATVMLSAKRWTWYWWGCQGDCVPEEKHRDSCVCLGELCRIARTCGRVCVRYCVCGSRCCLAAPKMMQ